MVTENTLEAENMTKNLLGIDINLDLTENEMDLKEGNTDFDNQLLNYISMLNRKTIFFLKI